MGTSGLNVAMLQYQSRDIIEWVAQYSSEASARARSTATGSLAARVRIGARPGACR